MHYYYVNMLGRNYLITYYLLERKAVATSLQLREGKKPMQEQRK